MLMLFSSRSFVQTFIVLATFSVIGLSVLFFALMSLAHAISALVGTMWSPIFMVLLPSVTAVAAIAVVYMAHPVHNLLSLISVFFSVVVLYLYVGAEFLAFTFLIVYVGAIAILFLFVIMLLNVKELTATPERRFLPSEDYAIFSTIPAVAWIFAEGLKGFDRVLLESNRFQFATLPSADNIAYFVNYKFTDVLIFSDLLYTHYSYIFMLIALLLLTAMIGAIVLATSTTD